MLDLPPVPYGQCLCGCGEYTELAPVNNRSKQWIRGKPKRFINGHGLRGSRHPYWKGGKGKTSEGYIRIYAPEHPNATAQGYVLEHVLVASAALGKPLPLGAVVHHVNGDHADNRPENLVVCQDNGFHHHLHMRERALEECGNANWFKCRYCKQWDDPANMHGYVSRGKRSYYHRLCRKERDRGHAALALLRDKEG